jgi:Uma2 family endonuclease
MVTRTLVTAEQFYAHNPDTVLGPDVAFVQAARVPPEGVPKKHWPMAPDLAVDIVSPRDRAGEIARKVARYLHAGTQMVWVLYPEKRTVVVHERSGATRTLADGDTLDGGDVVPGFTCQVSALWP